MSGGEVGQRGTGRVGRGGVNQWGSVVEKVAVQYERR